MRKRSRVSMNYLNAVRFENRYSQVVDAARAFTMTYRYVECPESISFPLIQNSISIIAFGYYENVCAIYGNRNISPFAASHY